MSVFCTGFFNKITEYGFVIKKYGFSINPGKKIIVASVYGDQCLKGAFFTGNPRSLQQKMIAIKFISWTRIISEKWCKI